MAGLQGRFAAKANPMQEMMAKKKAEEAERHAKLQKKAKMAARIAALGIQDDKLTATEKEAKRRASISLQCQAMSFEKNDIDPKMKRMMRSGIAGKGAAASGTGRGRGRGRGRGAGRGSTRSNTVATDRVDPAREAKRLAALEKKRAEEEEEARKVAAMQARVAAATEAKLREAAEAEAAQLAESGMSPEEIAAQQAEQEARREAAAAAATAREAEEAARRAKEAEEAASAKAKVQAALEAQRAAEAAEAAAAAQKLAEEEAIEAEVRRIRARSMAETFKGEDRVQATMAHVERQASATKLRRLSMRPSFQRRMSSRSGGSSAAGEDAGPTLQDAVAKLREELAETSEMQDSDSEGSAGEQDNASDGGASSGVAGGGAPPSGGHSRGSAAGGPPPGGPPPHKPPTAALGGPPKSKRSDSMPMRPPPKFNPKALTPSMAPPPPRPGAGITLAYGELRSRNAQGKLSGLQVANLEAHLSAEDFERVFEMASEEFSALPAWCRVALRKKAKLFVPQ